MDSQKIDILGELYKVEPTLATEILKNLSGQSLVNCQSVSKQWNEIYQSLPEQTKKEAYIHSIPGKNWFMIYLGYRKKPHGPESYGKDVPNLGADRRVRRLVKPQLSASQAEIMLEGLQEIRGNLRAVRIEPGPAAAQPVQAMVEETMQQILGPRYDGPK